MSIAEKAKISGTIVLIVVAVLVMTIIGVLIIKGTEWIFLNATPFLIGIAPVILLLDVLLFVLCVIPKFRAFCGNAVLCSSFYFIVTTWLFCFGMTYEIWGAWAAWLGAGLAGVMIFPFGLLAALFKGAWVGVFSIILLAMLSAAAYGGGNFLLSRAR